MLKIVQFVKGLTSLSKIRRESTVFKLHYMLTSGILLGFSIIVTAKQFAGDPINCTGSEVQAKVANSYCWIHTTYTVPPRSTPLPKDKMLPATVYPPPPGVESSVTNKNENRMHTYYQWVFSVLVIQALSFYAPRFLWVMWEAGKIKGLIEDFSVGVLDDDERQVMEGLLINYILKSKSTHDGYAAKYLLCEALAFTNVFAQFFILNSFLEGSFFKYGSDVMFFVRTSRNDEEDPRLALFPQLTKCIIFDYGSSESLQPRSLLCFVPLNVVNEKIYFFLWFWFIVLNILSALSFLIFVLMFAFPRVRYYVLTIQYQEIDCDSVRVMTQKTSFGDFFLIYLISLNVDIMVFESLVPELAAKMNNTSKDHAV